MSLLLDFPAATASDPKLEVSRTRFRWTAWQNPE
jgi:hypothetical protein